jgi:hypothetical protein
MRYFYASEKTAQHGGWDGIIYIGFPSVGYGTMYRADGTTKVFDERLSFALEAVADGSWVEVFPFADISRGYGEYTGVDSEQTVVWDDAEDNDRDFLITATIQVIVRAEDRVIARLIAAETLRDYISDSPYPNDVMNGLTIDDVEDLMEQD